MFSLGLPTFKITPLVNAFKAARLFDPTKVTDLHPDASMIEDLKSFHFLEEAIPDLKKELSTYLAFADGVAEVSLVDWWMRHEQKLPCWAEPCQKVLLCQPSSGAVERVFSTLNNSFKTIIIELSLMLQHNKRC